MVEKKYKRYKMITKYELFNESLRDKMTGKSADDIKQKISKMDVANIFKHIDKYNLDNSFLPSDKEIKDYLL